MASTKFSFRGKQVLATLIDIPFSISPVIVGLAFLMTFGRLGWTYPAIRAINQFFGTNIRITFALPGVVLSTIFVTFPFVSRDHPDLKCTGQRRRRGCSIDGSRGIYDFPENYPFPDEMGTDLWYHFMYGACVRRVWSSQCTLKKSSGSGECRSDVYKGYLLRGRPSVCDGYDATSSAGSNKGPTNQEYLDEVKARIDTFLVHHPYLSRKEVPAEMVTASGSGLDPNITPQCAHVQVKRVAQARGLREEIRKSIVDESIETVIGIFGDRKSECVEIKHSVGRKKWK